LKGPKTASLFHKGIVGNLMAIRVHQRHDGIERSMGSNNDTIDRVIEQSEEGQYELEH
jgi:hypothetical protein